MEGQGFSVTGMVVRAASYVAATIGLLWQKATSDGTLAAAGRLGVDELGAALKAFPESIQAAETGTLFNPTQGEVAAGRKGDVFGHRSPPGIVGGRHGVYGPEHDRPAHRSPSEIAGDRGGNAGVPDRGIEHGREMGRGD